MDKNDRRAAVSWLFVGALFVLCAVLGSLQYRWIGEVSVAERERLKGSLQASLIRLSQDFNSEITSAARAILPRSPVPDEAALEPEIAAHYERWRTSSHNPRLFGRMAIAAPGNDSVVLRMMDLGTGTFSNAEWPQEWSPLKERIETGLRRPPWDGHEPPPPDPRFDTAAIDAINQGAAFEVRLPGTGPHGGFPGRFTRAGGTRVIFELNLQYVGSVVLPEAVHRHLGAQGALEYDVEVVTRGNPPELIYASKPAAGRRIEDTADASVNLFEISWEQILHRWMESMDVGANTGRGSGPSPAANPRLVPGRFPGGEFGRWRILARHRAGSLEAAVERVRYRNLAVTLGVLLLMVAALAALIRFTRRAQKLAELQMDFVAGISHELRTPLTVIHTAAYNLQKGRMAQNPGQVERYGALIQKESARLTELVEQVLQFAKSKTGHMVQDMHPLSVEAVIEGALECSKGPIEAARCLVEKEIEPALPEVMGHSSALKGMLENLITNAAKYGSDGSRWIGIRAYKVGGGEAPAVEIRVADRGPGIPPDEQGHIFDAFFRGRRALENQVHGTGLGLHLAKRIADAHGGSIRLRSEPAKGAEFIVRLPAAPVEKQHEFAHSSD